MPSDSPSRSTSQQKPEQAGLRAGRYELLQRLATGGMGEVFVARQTGRDAFEKRLALKLLLPHLSNDPRLVRMFLDEARIAARLNHPNIVPIFDLGEADDGRSFIAMALVEGVSLAQLIRAARKRGTPLPVPMVRRIGVSLCEALDYAHGLKDPNGESRAVIHRDVSPSNVLLSTSGAVQLTDFGIAKAQGDRSWSRSSGVEGKLAYMAPEQLEGSAADPRVDLYATALTLFEALTLVSAFSRTDPHATRGAVLSQPLPDARSAREDADEPLCRALARAAMKRPEDRYGSARELREALLEGPVAAPHELGEWVASTCAGDIQALSQPVAGHTVAMMTRSALAAPANASAASQSPTAALHVSRAKRWLVGAGVALLPMALTALALSARQGVFAESTISERMREVSRDEAAERGAASPGAPAGYETRDEGVGRGAASGVAAAGSAGSSDEGVGRGAASGVVAAGSAGSSDEGVGRGAASGVVAAGSEGSRDEAARRGAASGVVAAGSAGSRDEAARRGAASGVAAAGPARSGDEASERGAASGVAAAGAAGSREAAQLGAAGAAIDTSGAADSRPSAEVAVLAVPRSSATRDRRASAVKQTSARERRSKPKAGLGYLTLDSQPWADVYRGSTPLDRTPLSRFPLEAGEHLLTFRNAQLGLEKRQRVRITANRETRLRVELTP